MTNIKELARKSAASSRTWSDPHFGRHKIDFVLFSPHFDPAPLDEDQKRRFAEAEAKFQELYQEHYDDPNLTISEEELSCATNNYLAHKKWEAEEQANT